MLKELKRSILMAWRFCWFVFWKTFWERQEVTFYKSLSQLFLLVLAELSFTSRLALLALLKAPVQPCSSSQPFEFKLRGSFPFLRVHTWGITHVFPRKRGEKYQFLRVVSQFWVARSCLLCSCSCKKYFKWFWTACVKSWQPLYSNVTSCFEKNHSPKKR